MQGNWSCRATEGGGAAAFGLTAAQAGAMGVPAQAAAGPVTSTSGATRILLLVNCVNREELLDDECDPYLSAKNCVTLLTPSCACESAALSGTKSPELCCYTLGNCAR